MTLGAYYFKGLQELNRLIESFERFRWEWEKIFCGIPKQVGVSVWTDTFNYVPSRINIIFFCSRKHTTAIGYLRWFKKYFISSDIWDWKWNTTLMHIRARILKSISIWLDSHFPYGWRCLLVTASYSIDCFRKSVSDSHCVIVCRAHLFVFEYF